MNDFHKYRQTLQEKMNLLDDIRDDVQETESVDEAFGNRNLQLINKIKNSGVVKTGSMAKDKPKDTKDSKKEGLDIEEISLDHLKKQITASGLKSTKKANRFDKTKNDLAAMKKRFDSKKPMTLAKEAKEAYKLHHKTFSGAVQTAKVEVEKRGYEVDVDDWDTKIASGPRKPSSGKTNSYSIKLSKNGKPSKQALQIQVYNMDNKAYELNMYVG